MNNAFSNIDYFTFDLIFYFILLQGSETPENHANYVWSNLILPKAAAKYIAIVAHSYGGIVAVNMVLIILYSKLILKLI